jgi:hypothetical protein
VKRPALQMDKTPRMAIPSNSALLSGITSR